MIVPVFGPAHIRVIKVMLYRFFRSEAEFECVHNQFKNSKDGEIPESDMRNVENVVNFTEVYNSNKCIFRTEIELRGNLTKKDLGDIEKNLTAILPLYVTKKTATVKEIGDALRAQVGMGDKFRCDGMAIIKFVNQILPGSFFLIAEKDPLKSVFRLDIPFTIPHY